MTTNKELRINCSFYPGKYKDQVRQLLAMEQVSLCSHIYERLQLGKIPIYSLKTEVVTGSDQRFSHRMYELNLDLCVYPCDPVVRAVIGADQLLDSLQRSFVNLAGVGLQVTYLSGLTYPVWSQAVREER